MRHRAFFLGLMAIAGVSTLRGQSAVDVKRPEERARERKSIERRETQKARSTDLEIRGATAFKEEELRSVLKEQIATIHDFGLTAARADDAAFFLELFYRKHGYAKVDVRYSIESGSRLVLDVTEGPEAILGTINFVGNNHVPAEKLFEYAVGPTRERYSRLQKELPFVASDTEEGADLVHRYYVGEGYLDSTVDPPQYHFSADGTRVDVAIPVHEGRQYFFGNLIFRGNPVYDAATLRGQMVDLLSQPYTDRRVDDISRRLQAYYKARGYYAVKVEATGELEASVAGHVPVVVVISPGPVYKFDDVNVTGLRRLRLSYVRNRFASLRGKTYSPDVLDEKFRELMRTGLFNVLQINPQPEGGNYLRLDIAAEEAKAKEFGVSVGYGSYTGGIFGVQWADRNLFGYGRPLITSIEVSQRGYKGEILWDDPHFLESDIELKIRLSALTFDYDGYSKFEIGERTEFSYNITEIPIDERFFNGGSTTVRSFGERDLGPHDRHDYPIGGEFYTIFNVEYTFPLYGELQGAVFVDAGNLLPEADNPNFSDMRYGIGAGLRYKLPVGPIRLDYGVNPSPREHEDFGAFHFSFGFAF